MSIRKINPHHFDVDSNVSAIHLSFASEKKMEQTFQESVEQGSRKMRLLSLLISSIYNKKIANAFRNIRFKPLRTIQVKKRLVEVFLGYVRRNQYNNKYEGFHELKRIYLRSRNMEIKSMQATMSRARVSTAKILSILFREKQKNHLKLGFKKIMLYAQQKSSALNQKYRKGFRKWINVKNTVIRKYFARLRTSRYLIERRLKTQSIAKILGQYRQRSLKAGIDSLRRNMYRLKQSLIKSEIQSIESRMENTEDEEIKTLKQKQEQLEKSLMEVRKQKQEISQAYQIEVKEAESKNSELQTRLSNLKQQNERLDLEIKQVTEKLRQEFSLDEIFQMFYNNLLLYIAKNRNGLLLKEEMLQAMKKPLIPVNIQLDQLKDENKTLKDLLSEYVLIYGQKTIEGNDLQIPYEFLVKENQTMYKMLLTLLPRLQYNKKDATDLRETLQQVESVVKQFKG